MSTQRALSLRFAAGCCAKVLQPRCGQVLLSSEPQVGLRDPGCQSGLTERAIPLFPNRGSTRLERRDNAAKMIREQVERPAGVAQGDRLASNSIVPPNGRLLTTCVERHLVQPSRQEER